MKASSFFSSSTAIFVAQYCKACFTFFFFFFFFVTDHWQSFLSTVPCSWHRLLKSTPSLRISNCAQRRLASHLRAQGRSIDWTNWARSNADGSQAILLSWIGQALLGSRRLWWWYLGPWFDFNTIFCRNSCSANGPFAQLLPGLETEHPVTVSESPAHDFSVSDEQKGVFSCLCFGLFWVQFICR